MTTLHVDILLALAGAGEFGLKVENLQADLRRGRHRLITTPEVERALSDLGDRSFADAFTSEFGEKRWLITQRGRLALQREGVL